jgi:hypothetical protein
MSGKLMLVIGIIWVLLVLLSYSAFAAPFLVCDVDPEVTSYLLKINGAPVVEVPAPLMYDLKNLGNGDYAFEVAAKNVWGSSAYVPFGFTKKLPKTPLGVRVSADGK